ncbi:MAG TPA: 2-iminoacetate synthase ThiH [Bacteroidia bacterium]|jgi:2-iminoacetate synthase|nr:2-iminoacetate synthase ThiH [Bacteroidia bacterium]
MNTFRPVFQQHPWAESKDSIYSKTSADVRRALQKERPDLDDFKALISPAAAPYLEEMARRSQELTIKRFGRTLQMYAPLYLSNECQNICTYCAFSLDNPILRKTLTDAELIAEAIALKKWGYDHVLLVTGESSHVGLEYMKNAIRVLRPYFSHISIEVQPLGQEEYEALAQEGLSAVLVYQETYREETYKTHHPKGKKSNFYYRLETPDRIGAARIHKIGLGSLIGLEDWRTDSFFCALHLQYLEKTYWETRYSLSFPRLRPIETEKGGQHSKQEFASFMNDRELVQLICAFRLFRPELELSLSTRESEKFRNHIIALGITSLSAGSKTNPGGYASEAESLEQFEISDERSPAEIEQMITQAGYEAVWKDWDRGLQTEKK